MILCMLVHQIFSEDVSKKLSRRQEVSAHDFSRAGKITNLIVGL